MSANAQDINDWYFFVRFGIPRRDTNLAVRPRSWSRGTLGTKT